MFVYLSFLRPPPSHAKADTPISFTPQIANDLRTELWETPIDVYYHWVSPSLRTRNLKLLTWKSQSGYKVVSVNPPPITASNRIWSLCLNTRDSALSDVRIDLRIVTSDPLPVLSAPIQFESSKSKPASLNWEKKLEEIERIYKFDDTAQIVVREKTAYDLDKVR